MRSGRRECEVEDLRDRTVSAGTSVNRSPDRKEMLHNGSF